MDSTPGHTASLYSREKGKHVRIVCVMLAIVISRESVYYIVALNDCNFAYCIYLQKPSRKQTKQYIETIKKKQPQVHNRKKGEEKKRSIVSFRGDGSGSKAGDDDNKRGSFCSEEDR
jgi:hypothetical protein